MFELISRLNLSYLCVFALILISVIHVKIARLKGFDVRIHEFSVAETKPLRGLMALLIILTHVSFKFPDTDYTWLFTTFGAPVVSVFFFLSGYGLTVSLIRKGRVYLNGFLSKSLKKLLIPFIIASVLWVVLAYIFLNQDIVEMIKGFFTFNPPLPYSWFVYALILLYIFFYISSKLITKLQISAITQVVTTFVMVVIFRLLDFGVYWYISLFAFNAGNIYAIYHKQGNSILQNHAVITLLMVLFVLVIMDLLKIRTGLLSIIPLGVVCSILILGGGSKFKIMNFLGSISYEIYLMHGIAITLLDNHGISWGIYVITATAITVISAYILHIICNADFSRFARLC